MLSKKETKERLLSRARNQGFDCGITEKGILEDNPYPRRSAQRKAWFLGWIAGAEEFIKQNRLDEILEEHSEC